VTSSSIMQTYFNIYIYVPHVRPTWLNPVRFETYFSYSVKDNTRWPSTQICFPVTRYSKGHMTVPFEDPKSCKYTSIWCISNSEWPDTMQCVCVWKAQENQECQKRTEYITFRPITMIICYAETNIVNKDMKTLSDAGKEICLTSTAWVLSR